MLITFPCETCRTVREVDAAFAGNAIDCPSCKTPLTIPLCAPGPGTTLGGFKIQKLIASGGMGKVFLARQLSMDRDVALKVLASRGSADPEDLDRFLNEVRLVAIYDDKTKDILYSFPSADPGHQRVGPCIENSLVDVATHDFHAVEWFSETYDMAAGLTGAVRGGGRYEGTLFEFASPLALNPNNVLMAIRIEDQNPGLNYAGRGLALFGASAQLAP